MEQSGWKRAFPCRHDHRAVVPPVGVVFAELRKALADRSDGVLFATT